MTWKIIDEELLSENPWTSFWRRGFESDRGARGNYFFAKTHGGCSIVIPVLPDGRFVMIREYRFLDDVMSVEFPGGGIEIGQTPEIAARKELREEVGYKAAGLELIGRSSPDMGVVIDPTYFFVARDISFVGTAREEMERIETIFVTEAEINAMIREGKIMCGQTLSAWAIFRARG